MINYFGSIDETPECECGAPLERGWFLCRECRTRDRWVWRQTAKRRTTTRSGQTRRPANRPYGIAEAEVIWT
ncbi:hypothetical protein [Streptosporangium minutum]|uniref:Uncharacterized protein n=1 Tax=Streptosporangium minutum TaxID=569862 RepID=A0A243RUU0_9ACTN|nr:hypothetical protein [Streptosporangium minutum]OUC98925.1 hypothetical protein CA984_05310 [Streptosporangium minutum]